MLAIITKYSLHTGPISHISKFTHTSSNMYVYLCLISANLPTLPPICMFICVSYQQIYPHFLQYVCLSLSQSSKFTHTSSNTYVYLCLKAANLITLPPLRMFISVSYQQIYPHFLQYVCLSLSHISKFNHTSSNTYVYLCLKAANLITLPPLRMFIYVSKQQI
jgi:hypothetical protein